jgi:hypothetical protein
MQEMSPALAQFVNHVLTSVDSANQLLEETRNRCQLEVSLALTSVAKEYSFLQALKTYNDLSWEFYHKQDLQTCDKLQAAHKAVIAALNKLNDPLSD